MRGPALRRTAAAAAVVLLSVLPGCSSSEDKYCETWSEEQRQLAELGEGGASTDLVTPVLASYERLDEVAPDELADEYSTLVKAYSALADAIEEVGVDPADYQPDQRPAGVTGEEARQLAAVASKLAAPRVRQAAAGIEDHANQVCEREGEGEAESG